MQLGERWTRAVALSFRARDRAVEHLVVVEVANEDFGALDARFLRSLDAMMTRSDLIAPSPVKR
jgi:hypothetical protein